MSDSDVEQGNQIKDKTLPLRARPFLKWAGGKTQLVDIIKKKVPKDISNYYEPFLGGGALFFSLSPKSANLSDVNEELVNLYTVVRDNVEDLINDLKKHRYEKEYYYQIRELDRAESFKKLTNIEKASRLLFLNKTCFNGLYRLNSRGEFNVPFGRHKNPKILDVENLRACSLVLKGSNISCANYLSIEEKLREGDFVYFDPPYYPLNPTSNFTSYYSDGFRLEDQVALRDLCLRLNEKKIRFILSNSSADKILELYSTFNIVLIDASRSINSKGNKRGIVKESLVSNF